MASATIDTSGPRTAGRGATRDVIRPPGLAPTLERDGLDGGLGAGRGASLPRSHRLLPDPRTSSRLAHDLAQTVTHARLELETGSAAGRDAALRCLVEAERLLAGGTAGSREVGTATLRAVLEAAARSAVATRTNRASEVTSARIRVRVVDDDAALVDASIVARLVRNLVWNAVEASPARGRVWVDGSRDGRELRVEVRDEGRGMSRALRSRLYATGSERPRGHGVGARSVAACAALLGARIEVETQRGRGSRVRVRWTSDGPKPVVALVDALDERRQALAAELVDAGWRVVEARGARELHETLEGRSVTTLLVARGTPIEGESCELATLARSSGDCRVRWGLESLDRPVSLSPVSTEQNGHYQT